MTNWAEIYAHIPILSIEELLKLPEPQEYDAGVYFLWEGGALTYIGKSKHVCERLYHQTCMNRNIATYQGKRAKYVPFDKVTCLVLERGQFCSPGLAGLLTSHERAYIAAYEPAFNEETKNGFT